MEQAWYYVLLEATLKGLFLVAALIMPLGGLFTWQERRQMSFMQDRVGPNRADIFGFTLAGIPHFLADGIKMVFKEDFQPAMAQKFLFQIAPLLAVAPAIIVWAMIPFGDGLLFMWRDVPYFYKAPLVVSNADAGILALFAVVSIGVFGTVIAGYASDNKLGLIGSVRASAQMISYEVTMGLSLIGVFMIFGTVNLYDIAQAQTGTVWGVLPNWGVVYQPLAAVLFFFAAYAETKRGPFDMPEGESEIVGYFVEYSGMKFGMFMLAEYIAMLTTASLLVVMFFGAHHIPYLSWNDDVYPWLLSMVTAFAAPADPAVFDPTRYGIRLPGTEMFIQSASLFLCIMQFTVFVLKSWVLCFVQIGLRWSLPRFRYDQLMNFGWGLLLPLSIVNAVVTLTALLVFGWPAFA